jgi:hypothetical protein
MARNEPAWRLVVLVSALLWLVAAWHAPKDAQVDLLEVAKGETGVPELGPPTNLMAPAATRLAPVSQTVLSSLPSVAGPPPTALSREPPAALVIVTEDMFLEDLGPVSERKRAYASEPRDSAANEAESEIRAAFAFRGVARDLLKSVLCRQSTCKIELRWSQERTEAYIDGIGRALANLEPEIAVSPAGPPGFDLVRPIDVYVRRKR